MNKRTLVILLCGVAALAAVAASYAGCFAYVYEAQCVRVGDCYSSCTPSGCSQTTCMIATQAGYEFEQLNVLPVSVGGVYSTRVWDSYSYNTCSVGGCKIFNACTYTYEFSPINGCSADFLTKRYTPAAQGCN